jgi:SAM-dependent methyltransferase
MFSPEDKVNEEPVTSTISGRTWDSYLDSWSDVYNSNGELTWPGDEWGTPEQWDELFGHMFRSQGVRTWTHVVEIGPGSGKYTERVLSESNAQVRGYDVSAEFLAVCEARCRDAIAAERLSLHLLKGAHPREMLDDLEQAGLRRRIDAMYTIDAMVHVDLQYLVVYFITAGLVLRPEGKLILTLSNAVSREGFEKLVGDISWTYTQQASPSGSGKFEWLSPEITRYVLEQIGFDVQFLGSQGRDSWVIATLRDLDRAQQFENYLVHKPDAR